MRESYQKGYMILFRHNDTGELSTYPKLGYRPVYLCKDGNLKIAYHFYITMCKNTTYAVFINESWKTLIWNEEIDIPLSVFYDVKYPNV